MMFRSPRCLFLSIVWTVLFMLLPNLTWAQLKESITLLNVVGQVTVVDASEQSRPGATGMPLQVGDTVLTTSSASALILFSNGAAIAVESDSSLTVEGFARRNSRLAPPVEVKEQGASTTRLVLDYGQIVGEVERLNPESSFDVKTPVGTAGIRGTTFVITVRKNPDGSFTASFGVGKGLVEVDLTGAAGEAVNRFLGTNNEATISARVGDDGAITVTENSLGDLGQANAGLIIKRSEDLQDKLREAKADDGDGGGQDTGSGNKDADGQGSGEGDQDTTQNPPNSLGGLRETSSSPAPKITSGAEGRPAERVSLPPRDRLEE